MERKQQQIFGILAKSVRQLLEQEGLDMGQLQEIRMRIGKPLLLIYQNEERFLPFTKGKHQRHIVTREEIRETLDYVSHYSLYAYERDIRQGFLTVEGGHRIGVMGKVIMEQNTIKNLQYISSVNVRVSHEIRGCADHILPYITKEGEICHTLIISPPRCG